MRARPGAPAGSSASSTLRNALAADESRFCVRCATYRCRTIGKPSTDRTARQPICNSSSIVCADTTAKPSPARTACLMASLVPNSQPGRMVKPCAAKCRSAAARVPEQCGRRCPRHARARPGRRLSGTCVGRSAPPAPDRAALSSCFICIDTAGCVRCNSLAARETEPCFATASKMRR